MRGERKNFFGVSRYIYILAIIGLSALFQFTFSSSVFASESLSLSVSSNVVDLDIVANNPTSTFKKSSPITISASTTNLTGYTLSISAGSSTNYNKLIHTGDNTSSLNSITTATTESAFSALNGTSYNGTWGYLPSKYASSVNTDFRPAPTTSGDIIEQTSTANTTANDYTVAIGARVDQSTKVGYYSNVYVVKLVANTIPYSITYDDNVVSNMPTDIMGDAPSNSVSISSKTPVRAGYTFKGWCDTVPTGDGSVCPGTTYQPSAAYALNGASSNDLTLYALWELQGAKVNFAGTGITSVTFSANGYATKTVSASGGVADLVPGVAYTVTASLSSGYELASWSLNSSSYGTLGSGSANPTTFTPNANYANAIITATGQEIVANKSLTITWTNQATGNATSYGNPIAIQVRTAPDYGGDLVGTIASSGDSVSGLAPGTTYYIAIVFSGSHVGSYGYVSSWNNTGGSGTLSDMGSFSVASGSQYYQHYGRYYQASFIVGNSDGSINIITNGVYYSCFPAGTQVATSLDGDTRPIEEIKAGDQVVSYNIHSGEFYMAEVVANTVHDGDRRTNKLAHLNLSNGTTLTMTLNHPILTTNGFKAVEKEDMPALSETDTVKTMSGDYSIQSLFIQDVEPTTTYNLDIKDFDESDDDDTYDTFIVNGVIVHNAC